MKRKIKLSLLNNLTYLISLVLTFALSLNFFYHLLNLKNFTTLDFLIIFLSLLLYFTSKLKEDKTFNFQNIYKNLKQNRTGALFPEIVRLGSAYGFSISLFYFLSNFFSNFLSSFIIKETGSLLENTYVDLFLDILIVIPLIFLFLFLLMPLYFATTLIFYFLFSPLTSNLSISRFQKVKEIFHNLFLKNKTENLKLNLIDIFILFVSLIISFFVFFYFLNFLFLKLNLDPHKSLLDNLEYLWEIIKIKKIISFLLPLPLYAFLKLLFDEKTKKELGLKIKVNLSNKSQEI